MSFNIVENLAETTQERAQFLVEEHGRGVYLHTATGDNAVQVNARLGKVNYLHASAAGKAIFANIDDERVDEIIDRWGLPRFTTQTITDRNELSEELGKIKDRGYSFNYEESISGLRAVGTPVMGQDGQVIGALSVSGPTNRLKGEWIESDIPDLLLGAANELELNIEFE
jgi:DNA-binding IclR family transcriptional regulator